MGDIIIMLHRPSMVAIYFADRNSEFLHVCVVAVQDLLISDETSPYTLSICHVARFIRILHTKS